MTPFSPSFSIDEFPLSRGLILHVGLAPIKVEKLKYDTIGALTGAIGGAYHGRYPIPPKFLENTEIIDEMIEVVNKLPKCHPKENDSDPTFGAV